MKDLINSNGSPDSSTHVHGWQEPGSSPFFDHGPYYGGRVISTAWQWCCLCGALADMSNGIIYIPSFEYGKNDLRHKVAKEGRESAIADLRALSSEVFQSGRTNEAIALRDAAKKLQEALCSDG